MKRWCGAAVVGALLAPVVLLAGPGARSADALVAPPLAPAFPSSLFAGALTPTAAPAAAAASVTTGATSGTLIAGGGTSLAAAGGAAVAGTAGVGLFMGFSIGTGVASMFGLDTAGATVELLGLGPGSGFEPNTDIVIGGADPGWTAPPVVTGGGTCYPQAQACDYAATFTAPPTAVLGGLGSYQTTYAIQVSVANKNAVYSMNPYFSAFAKCVNPAVAGSGASVGSAGLADYIGTACTAANSSGLDRIEVSSVNSAGASEVVAVWYPEGHQLRPAPATGDVERAWETRTTCSTGPVSVARSALFSEAASGFPVPVGAACATGYPLSYEIWEVAPTAPELDRLVSDVDLFPSGAPAETLVPAACWDVQCALTLHRVDVSPALACSADPSACLDWWESPTKAQQFECRYGGLVLDLAECRVLRPTFNHQLGQRVKTDAGVSITPAPHGNPLSPTGDPVPAAGSAPAPAAPDNGCPPAFSVTNFITGYLVYKGVLCALQAAFVPAPGFLEAEWAAQQVDFCTNAAGIIPCTMAEIVGPFSQLGQANGADNGCLGLHVDMLLPSNMGSFDFYPMQACGEVKVLSDFWLIMSTALVYLACVMLAGRMLARTIGAQDAVV